MTTSPFVQSTPILQSLRIHNTMPPLEKNATDMVWPIELDQKLLARGHSLLQV
jgi:hypothetical protein